MVGVCVTEIETVAQSSKVCIVMVEDIVLTESSVCFDCVGKDGTGVCVFVFVVCVCERERERERGGVKREGEQEWEISAKQLSLLTHSPETGHSKLWCLTHYQTLLTASNP